MASSSLVRMRRSVSEFLLDAFDGVLGSELQHAHERRNSFISTNFMAGVIGIALWPLHWALIGPVDVATGLAFCFLWVPLFLGLWVRSGGDLEQGQAVSALALGGFVTVVAVITGGLSSPALPWLLIVPLEAAVSGRRGPVTSAAALSAGGFLLCAVLPLFDAMPASRIDPSVAAFVYGASLAAALVVSTLSIRSFQRRHAHDLAAARSEAVLGRSLMMASPDLLSRHAPDGTVLFASPAIEGMVGIHVHEFEGLSPAMFVHIQDLRSFELAMQRVRSMGPQRIEFRMRRRDGSYVPVEMHAQGVEGQIVAVTRDISAKLAEVTSLMMARDQAEETAQARLRFLASVTHELRTPLNAIIGFSDMMRNDVFGPLGHPKYKEYTEHIRDSGLHLVDIVSDLLDMSKIEAGKFTIDRARVELKPLVDECIAMVAAQATAAGVSLESACAPGLTLFADRRALKQSIVNLLSNSVKFTLLDGRVRLEAREAGDDVIITVADTGVGIPQHELERIGKPFEQAEAGAKSLHKGTGLGLALVKSLAELHGGRMDIASALGDGTTVTLTLPQTVSEPQPSGSKLVYPEKFRARA